MKVLDVEALQKEVPFGARKHVAAEEARAAVQVDRRSKLCGAPGSVRGRLVRCNLPAGHGGVHALRLPARPHGYPDGPPTMVYKTVCRWNP